MTTPEPRQVRIGHEEREQAIRALNDHFAQGRLDMQEFEERVARVPGARTAADLDVLFADLPGPAPRPTERFAVEPARGGPVAYDPDAPYGREPLTGQPYSDKSRVIAGVLQLFFGGLGVGRFYTGHIGLAVAQLVVTLLTLGLGAIWGFVDGIVLLAGSPRDPSGRPLRS